MAFTTMVTCKWLAEKLISSPSVIRILDGSWHLPYTRRNPRQEFYQQHIPSAQFFDVDECADKDSELGHMLPTPETFENYVGKLGINNDTHVVIYDNNADLGIMSAPRVWWTFKAFGHDLVSVLDGGLPKWEKEGYELTDDVGYVEPQTFKSNFRPGMVKNFEELQENIDAKKFLVLDARPAGRFEGTSPEPRAGIKPGHMPGSVNIPFMRALNPDTKTIRTPDELKQMFSDNGVDLEDSKPLVTSCGSGISASMLILSAHLCGRDDVALYDGSWTEWYQRAKREHIISSKSQ